ncbi:MAG: UDP-N-acetylmuramate dehydrogenase [Lysinibacillus sp.]
MTIEKWLADLTQWIRPENMKMNEPLKNYTMTKLGGAADLLVLPKTEEQALQAIQYALQHDIPILMLGNGSNMVVRDGGVRGIVLHFSELNEVTINGTTVIAGAGALIKDVSKLVAAQSLTGFEFACGIPGSIGGAMAMNAGAYGGEMKDIIVSCKVISKDGKLMELTKDELDLGYRKSIIAKEGYYVLSATYELAVGDQAAIDAKIADLTFQRESKQPLEYPSAGSVFKRPPGMFAGKLIQDSELQGKGVGGAEVSQKHAGFIINKNNATATDYIETIKMVQRVVKEKFDVELEREVKIVGEDL